MSQDMRPFVRFLLERAYGGAALELPASLIQAATQATLSDVRYHYQVDAAEVAQRVSGNQNELAIFLYRLGRLVFQDHPRRRDLLDALHGLMRSFCACEIYFSNDIGEGFYLVHGLGTVIGSRNTIGKGFQIYQGCTIGHRHDFEDGCVIGDNVIMFTGSTIMGPVHVGSNAVIGAGCHIKEDVPDGTVCQLVSEYLRQPRHRAPGSHPPAPAPGVPHKKGPS